MKTSFQNSGWWSVVRIVSLAINICAAFLWSRSVSWMVYFHVGLALWMFAAVILDPHFRFWLALVWRTLKGEP